MYTAYIWGFDLASLAFKAQDSKDNNGQQACRSAHVAAHVARKEQPALGGLDEKMNRGTQHYHTNGSTNTVYSTLDIFDWLENSLILSRSSIIAR